MEVAQIVGTVVFALSGVLAVAGRRLDWFGGIVVGVVTAVGGGTMRGLILGVTPVFWIADDIYLYAAILGAVIGIPVARALQRRPARQLEEGIRIVDAIGLALFAIVGADIALELGFDPTVAVVSAVLTGAGGGVIRDVIAGRVPLILQGEIYATAAIAGATVFVVLEELTAIPEPVAGTIGGVVIFGLRVVGMVRDWRLPVLAAADRGEGVSRRG
jgi:uncharacterized membrane protein YeiH